MPLHRDQMLVALDLEGLDGAVVGPRHSAGPGRGLEHGLVVDGVHVELGLPQRLGQVAVGLELDSVHPFVTALVLVVAHAGHGVHMLDERAAEGHVGHLHAAADGEDGNLALEGVLEKGDVEGVATGIDVVGLCRGGGAVQRRLHVAPARHHHALDGIEHAGNVVGVDDGQHHRDPARPLDGLDVVPGRRVQQRGPSRRFVRLRVGGDPDDGLSGHDLSLRVDDSRTARR